MSHGTNTFDGLSYEHQNANSRPLTAKTASDRSLLITIHAIAQPLFGDGHHEGDAWASHLPVWKAHGCPRAQGTKGGPCAAPVRHLEAAGREPTDVGPVLVTHAVDGRFGHQPRLAADLLGTCGSSTSERWASHLEPSDSLRFWLSIAVPGAAGTFTLLAAISWWYSTFTGRDFLAGRTRCWFVIVIVAALSMTAGIIAAQVRSVSAVVLTAMVTTIGLLGLWLLPPTLSPRLLDALRKRGQRSARR
jgi:hypothetical protein